MKLLTRLYLLTIAALLACNQNDDIPLLEEATLEEATLSIVEFDPLIEIPFSIFQSTDAMAQQLTSWVQITNGLNMISQNLKLNSSATRSTRILPTPNRRMVANTFVTYSLSDPQANFNAALQIGRREDILAFEYFVRPPFSDNFHSYIYAEELETDGSGFLEVLDAFGNNTDSVLRRYEWQYTEGIFNVKHGSGQILYDFYLNQSDKSGTADYYFDNILVYRVQWDAQGNGEWKSFNQQEINQQGSWEAK